MLPEKYQWVGVQFEPGDGNPWLLLEIARELERDGNLEGAATVYDRAYGLDPHAEEVRQARADLLDRLAVVEHGLLFRYVPGGVFLMGGNDGEPDERPWHPVWLSPYWLSEAPVSWAAYCRLMDWEPPPTGLPRDWETLRDDLDNPIHGLLHGYKIRLQYCEDQTTRARDWHDHAAEQGRYETKPMVAASWHTATELATRLRTPRACYSLPSEAQWEKAARGGLIGARHAWGNAPPAHDRCDFDRFREFSILPSQNFPPNGYGLYAMNGGVWEWTRDWYDRDSYAHSPERDPEGPPEGEERVLRGGSWADCAEVVTVTFRMSRESRGWGERNWGSDLAPNIGFRLCRTAAP